MIPSGDPPHPSEETRPQGGEVSNSLPEAAWREGIARKALETESPTAIPPKAAACVRLLKEVLAKIASGEGRLPEMEEMEEANRQVEQYLTAKSEFDSRNKKKPQQKKENRNEFKYART